MMNNNRVMEKQPVGQEQPLKCPRCDSSNTKFCYYNNYSLSQPRHFCKGCKRYWTRGGTLRNVPVGGGCRKNNKRIFKKSSSSSSSSSAPPILQIPVSTPPLPPQTKSQINYPMFYGLPITPSEPNYPFPRLSDSRVSRTESGLSAGYDNNNLDSTSTGFLGYPSSSLSSNSLLSSYPVFRSSTTLASLIASRLEQRKFNNNATSGDFTNHDEGCNGNFVGMPPYNGAGNIILENGSVKMEGDGSVPMNNNQNVEETQGVVNINNNYSSTLLLSSSSSSDPSFPWNGFWMDPSSVPAFSHLAS